MANVEQERKQSGIPFVNGSAYLGRAKFLKNGAASETGAKMTVKSVGTTTGICFGILIIFAVIGWLVAGNLFAGFSETSIDGVQLAVPAGASMIFLVISFITALVLGIVNAVKREPSKPAILLYAAFEGVLIGAISGVYNSQYDGIVPQALFATLCVIASSVLLFRSGWVKAHESKLRRFIKISLVSYLILAVVNIVMVLLGVWSGWGIWSSGLGIAISGFAIILGGLMLSADIQRAQNGIEEGLPVRYSWSLAFALILDVVWIYLEILRLLAILSDRR